MRLISSFILIGHANPGPWGLIGHLGGTVLLILVCVHQLCQSVRTWSIQFLTNLYRWVRKVSKCSHTNLWTGFDGSKQNTTARLLAMHAFKTIYTHYHSPYGPINKGFRLGTMFKFIRRWLPSPTPRESRTATSVRLPWTKPAMWRGVSWIVMGSMSKLTWEVTKEQHCYDSWYPIDFLSYFKENVLPVPQFRVGI